jgi:hypothetical protein
MATSLDRTKPTLFSVLQLMNHLDVKFPDRCIQPQESAESAHRRGGERAVVEYILWVCSLNDDELPSVFEPTEEF